MEESLVVSKGRKKEKGRGGEEAAFYAHKH